MKPIEALLLQYTLQEPISLVSAYDVWLNRKGLVPVCKQFRRQGVLLLDSGGYESSRIGYYAGDKGQRWNFSRYAKVAGLDIHDFIFSYDYFLGSKETKNAFLRRVVRELRKHADVLDIAKLIPVVHLQSFDGERSLSAQETVDVFGAIVSEIPCKFVAVPERELVTRNYFSRESNSTNCHRDSH